MRDSQEVTEGSSTGIAEPRSKPPVSEQGSRNLSLLEVARIIHEKGKDIGPKIYDALEEKFETVKPAPPKPLRIVDDQRQIICRQDHDPKTGELHNLRQVTLLIGPQTPDHEAIINYPRISFYYRKKQDRWDYVGAQVGTRGAMIGTNRIVAQYNEQKDVRAYLLDNKVSMDDMERLLSPYLDDESDSLRLATPTPVQ